MIIGNENYKTTDFQFSSLSQPPVVLYSRKALWWNEYIFSPLKHTNHYFNFPGSPAKLNSNHTTLVELIRVAEVLHQKIMCCDYLLASNTNHYVTSFFVVV